MTIPECLRRLRQLSEPAYQPQPPASAAAIQALEHAAAVALPAELRALYQLSNGIDEYRRVAAGEESRLIGYLLLPAEEAAT